MSARPAIWAGGLAGSVALNAALLVLLAVAVRPDAMDDQPMPETELDVQAYRLERTEAEAQDAKGEQAAAADASGTPLGGGDVRRTRAEAVDAGAQPLAAAATPGDRLQPSQDRSEAVAPVARKPAPAVARPAVAQAVARVAPTAAAVIPASLRSAPVSAHQLPSAASVAAARPAVLIATAARSDISPAAAQRPDIAVIDTEAPRADALAVVAAVPDMVPVAPPSAYTVNSAAPETLPVAFATPDSAPAPAAEADSVPVPAAVADAERVKADLAFAGGDGNVDPVSLAAFQSFMHPGDAAAGADELRDGIAGLLAQVPCSRLQVGFDPDTATLRVHGHVPEDGLRAPVLAALRAQMGADIQVSDDILILPRPQCGALSGIADVGLPQSTDQITNPLIIGQDAHAREFRFAQGELLSLDMTAPDYAAYIYLDYFDAGGDVLHLEPNEFAPLRRAEAQAIQQIGARSMEGQGLKLVVGPPYGQEIAVAFAASEPLYDGLRPITEPAAAYLEWLKGRVTEARARDPEFKGEWVYFFVSTAER